MSVKMELVKRRPSNQIIKRLEKTLEMAKKGEIDGYAVVYTGPGIEFAYHKSTNFKASLLVGMDVLKREMTDQIMDTLTDID